ncbi:MAG: S8 family serine peptidase [Pirellula sp.]
MEKLELRSLMAADFMEGELLVQYGSENERSLLEITESQGAEVLFNLRPQGMDAASIARVKLPEGRDLEAALAAYERMPGVISVEYNQRVSKNAQANDPYYLDGSHWGLYSSDTPNNVGAGLSTNAFGSGAEVAWDREKIGSGNVVVGILDEGVDINHEDLRQNIWSNPGEIPNDGLDNDSNGYIDDVNGWDFLNRDNSVYDSVDGDDHGTHVAGSIGAVGGNGIGVAGINWNVKILPAKFLGPGGGNIADAVLAIDYMTNLRLNRGVNIVAVNNSWGGGGYSSALHAAIIRAANAGILFVAAAGNSYVDNDVYMTYPASYSTLQSASGQPAASYDSVISVAALTSSGDMAGYSNWGANTVDIAAPGTAIVSTLPGNTYGWMSGTSMAAPHVTGSIALMSSIFPNESAPSLRETILGSAIPTPSTQGKMTTGGRLSIADAMNYMSLPTVSISPNSILEGATGQSSWISFNVTLSSPVSEAFSVQYITFDTSATSGIDYGASSGAITFNPGDTNKLISVQVFGDNVAEGIETFLVELGSLTTRAVRFGLDVAVGTITDDDQTGLVVSDTVVFENAGSARFSVSLMNPSNSTVTVRFATANGTARAGKSADYLATSGTLTFAPGETVKTVNVTINNDKMAESNETFFLNLSNATGTTIQDAQGLGVIQDDDSTTTKALSVFDYSPDRLSASDWLLLNEEFSKRRGRR